jgi:hypothetical protein
MGGDLCDGAAVLAFFGFINGTGLGFANSAPVALGSVLLASVCLLVGRVRQSASAPLVATAEAGAEPAE